MNPDRAIAAILTLSVLVVLLLGIWLLRRAHTDSEPPAATPTVTAAVAPPTAVPTAATSPTVAAAEGYRLAGTVVGDLSYAIIEDPHGGNQLYRPGQTIPGLGEVITIEADRITLAGSDGTIALQLAPGATPTPEALATVTAATEYDADTTPVRRRRRDRSESESSP